MKKAKIISLLLIVFILVGLFAGCSGQGEKKPDVTGETPKTTTPDVEDEPWVGKRIGIAHITLYDEWCTEVKNELEKQGAEAGMVINVQDGNLNAETQQKQVEDFVAQHYDAIAIDSVSGDGIVPALQAAGDEGIPVFAFDSATSYEGIISYIAWDHGMTGELAARWIADYTRKNLDGKLRIGVLSMLNAPHTQIRSERLLQVLEEELGSENIEIVFNQDFGETRESASNIVNNNIMKPVDVIWGAVDNAAMGAVSALETNNIEGTIVTSSGLSGTEGLNMINQGGYYAMGVGDPYSARGIAKLLIETFKDYFSGKEIEPVQYVEFFPIDATIIDDYAALLD